VLAQDGRSWDPAISAVPIPGDITLWNSLDINGQYINGKSLMGKSPFLMGKSPFSMGKSQFSMGKSTINCNFQ